MRLMKMFRTAAMAPMAWFLLTSHAAAASPQPAEVMIDIPAGPLAKALELYATETHQQLLYSTEIVAGRTAAALKGRFTPDQALERLLSGSGIAVEHTSPTVIVLKPRSTATNVPQRTSDPVAMARAEPSPRQPEGPLATASSATSALPADDGASQEVVVTGTHIRGVKASASPLVEIKAEDLRRDGDATVADALNRLPQSFNGAATPNSLAVGSDRVATNFSSAQGVNLRGLGANATLVLIDGRRLAGTGSQGDFTDVSAIPTAAVDHVEVLLDGASAIYGSDAVGGVVNIVMKKDFRGAETSIRFGADSGWTAASTQFSQVFGFGWDGGHLLATLEVQHDDRLAAADRSYAANSDLTALGGTNHDVFLSSPGNILGFNAAGALVPQFAIPAGSGAGLKPTDFIAGATNEENIRLGTDLIPRQDRVGAYVSAEQALGPQSTLSATARYSRRSFAYDSNSEETEFSVTRANPFYVSPNGAASELIGYATDVTGPERQAGTSVSWDASAGLDQRIGRTWRLQGYGGYSEEIGRTQSTNFWNSTHLNEALGNTPDDPTTAFSTAKDGFFNPYGDGRSNSATILNFIDDGFLQTKDVGQIATLSLQGDGTVIALPGGPLKAAFGAQYRHERFEPSVFELASSTPFATGGTPFSREVAAVFGELNIPIIGADNAVPGIERLDLSLAGRIEHYSDVGTTKNPKVGLVWRPADDWRVHATYSTSFRAPTLPEVNTPLTVLPLSLASGGTSVIALLKQGGNPTLKPQTATTWTAGLDWTPARAPGLHIGASWFSIAFDNEIGQPANANIIAALSNPALASLITHIDNTKASDEALVTSLLAQASPAFQHLLPVSAFTAIIDDRFINASTLKVAGIDFNGDYHFALGPDRFTVFGAVSYLYDYTQRITASAPSTQLVDSAGFPVDWRGRLTGQWSRGDFSTAVTLNYVASSKDLVEHRSIAAWTTVDLSASWTPSFTAGPLRGLVVTAAVQNLFDQDPPFYDASFGVGYDPANTNPLGRVMSLRLSKRW